ncbi:MAG: preprotein translocase subunit SecG [Deltaproteobacteria bacterium]|nr:MAG: preprotein translocase subunit SecG [Deltaproteobacteria bacterium]
MHILFQLFSFFQLISAISLILLILLQPESSSKSNNLNVDSSFSLKSKHNRNSPLLSKITTIVAFSFFISSLLVAILYSSSSFSIFH